MKRSTLPVMLAMMLVHLGLLAMFAPRLGPARYVYFDSVPVRITGVTQIDRLCTMYPNQRSRRCLAEVRFDAAYGYRGKAYGISDSVRDSEQDTHAPHARRCRKVLFAQQSGNSAAGNLKISVNPIWPSEARVLPPRIVSWLWAVVAVLVYFIMVSATLIYWRVANRRPIPT